MPELPEVEHFKRIFEASAVGKTVKRTRLLEHPGRLFRVLQNVSVDEFRRATEGQRFIGAERRGKFVLAFLSNGLTVVFHFMLSGHLEPTAPGRPLDPGLERHASVEFRFADGSAMWFVDRRNLGRLFLTRNKDFTGLGVLAKMGVDPLSAEFAYDRFAEIVRSSKEQPIKKVLTDQSKIAGLGNEYSDLVDYLAGVRPARAAGSLTEPELRRAYEAIVKVLRDAVQDFFGARHEFMYQRRKGGRCPNHPDVELQAVKWGASHAYFCPIEQK